MASLAPEPNAIAEWMWLWVRMPVALVVGYAAPRVMLDGYPATLIVWDIVFMAVYSVAIFGLLRTGRLITAFWAGLILDSTILIITWQRVLSVPGVGAYPSDLYLILFPFLLAMIFRMGAVPGAIYSIAIIVLMSLGDLYYQGPGSYAVEQLALRVWFLGLTALWASVIVARIRARETALRDSESRFHRLFDIAPVGICISDERRSIVEANGALVTMLGYPEDQMIGKRLSEFEHEGVARESLGNYGRLVSGELDSYQMQRVFLGPDGQPVWAETDSAAVRDQSGNFLYAVRIVTDISAFVALNNAKDEFVATTSHELRTPLTAIHAAVGLAASGALGEVPESIARQLELAQANSQRLLTLVNDILLLEQVGLGSLSVSLAAADIGDVIAKAADALEPVARERSVQITTTSPSVMVDCDSARIAQVLTNLISNAMNVVPPHSTITVAGQTTPNAVTITVTDQGPGLPHDQLESIFKPFERVSRVNGGSAPGTGLGLAIAKGIVEQHGGRIWAANGATTGAVFTFSIPLV